MTLGILGGLGPIATAYFMELLIQMTKAERDQDHLQMLIYNMPQIPDRTAYILGKSEENPADEMIRLGKQLAAQGADCIAIPCITAHYFYEELSREIPVPVLHGIQKTAMVFVLWESWPQTERFKVVFSRENWKLWAWRLYFRRQSISRILWI